jgi:hypothetical protein
MIEVSANMETTFQEFVFEWVKLIKHGNFEDAVSLLDEPSSYGHWITPQELKDSIVEVPLWTSLFKTDISTQMDFRSKISVIEVDEGNIYQAMFKISPYGLFRNPYIQFEFRRRGDNFAVALEDMKI